MPTPNVRRSTVPAIGAVAVLALALSKSSIPVVAAPLLSGPPVIATFSCVGFDPETGDLGIAVQSKFFAVGSVVPWARADVGAIATQAFGNTSYGPRGLDMLAGGRTPQEVLDALTSPDSLRERRQVGIVDAKGHAVSYTGKDCMAWAGDISGMNFAVQGNILVDEKTVQAMADTFQKSKGLLGDRLLAALDAGQAAGGDSRGMESAALLIVRRNGGYAGYNDRYCDLRVDDAKDPFSELHRLYDIWKPNALVTEGYALIERGEFARAYAMGDEAISLRPDGGEYRYHLACYLSRGGEMEKSLQTLSEALRREPTLAKQAATDTDLAPLSKDPRFGQMLEAATEALQGKGAK